MIFNIHIKNGIKNKKYPFIKSHKNCKKGIRYNQLFNILLYTNNDILSLSFSLLAYLFLEISQYMQKNFINQTIYSSSIF